MGNDQAKKYNYVIQGQAEQITKIINELLKRLNQVDINIPDIKFRLEIAAREMLANAIEYGCQVTEDQIAVQFEIIKNKIVLIVEDPGEGFDWKNHNFKIEPVLDERGRGLKMINEVSDKIEFNNKGNLIKVTFLGGE